MLKTIHPLLGSRLLAVMAEMGHGDELLITDRNFPSESTAIETVSGELIELLGTDTTGAGEAILTLFPLDSFVDQPVRYMTSTAEPDVALPVHEAFGKVAEAAEGKPVGMGKVERFAFYEEAKKAYAVVRTSESRPYGNFLLKKGVVFD